MNGLLKKLPPQADLPPGDTYLCSICGSRIRVGQPHSAKYPRPHRTLEAMIVEATLDEDEHGRSSWPGRACEIHTTKRAHRRPRRSYAGLEGERILSDFLKPVAAQRRRDSRRGAL